MHTSDNSFDEFTLLALFFHLLKYWWIPVLAALAGGLIGFLFSRIHAPIYEAKATIIVNVDLDKVTTFPVERQDEELALYNIQVALLATQTIENLMQAAAQQNVILDPATFLKNQTIERKLVFWEVRYRDKDPGTAQKIVNLWVDEAYKTFQLMQGSGGIPKYVIIQGITPSKIPTIPLYYLPSWLTLAGGVIGLISGILVIETLHSHKQNRL